MKLTPYQLWLRSLTFGRAERGYLTREEAYARLKRKTGEDFGFDIERWREWGLHHPEISGMRSTPQEDGRD